METVASRASKQFHEKSNKQKNSVQQIINFDKSVNFFKHLNGYVQSNGSTSTRRQLTR